MPNYCQNHLSITGPADVLLRLAEQVLNPDGKTAFCLNSIIPQPFFDNDTDWYDWNVENWGTKWEIYDVVDWDWIEPTHLSYAFETAWSPPEPVIEKLAELYPDIEITHTYSEMGAGYAGRAEYSGGIPMGIHEGDIADLECDFLEDVMGSHHFCDYCGDIVECKEVADQEADNDKWEEANPDSDYELSSPLCSDCLPQALEEREVETALETENELILARDIMTTDGNFTAEQVIGAVRNTLSNA